MSTPLPLVVTLRVSRSSPVSLEMSGERLRIIVWSFPDVGNILSRKDTPRLPSLPPSLSLSVLSLDLISNMCSPRPYLSCTSDRPSEDEYDSDPFEPSPPFCSLVIIEGRRRRFEGPKDLYSSTLRREKTRVPLVRMGEG